MRCQEPVVEVNLWVFPTQNLGLNPVLSRIGGGFRSGGGAGNGGVPSEWGDKATWEAPSDEL